MNHPEKEYTLLGKNLNFAGGDVKIRVMKIKKVTFIYPGLVEIGFSSLGKGGMDHNWINLGLAYIGSFLKINGYQVDLIDLRELRDWEDVENELIRRKPEVVGIHFNTPNYDYAIKCAFIAKRCGFIVVGGGPHATISPESLLESDCVDYIIIGEGEISFLNLIRSLESGLQLKKIIEGHRVDNLDDLPFPDRNLYSMEKIIHPIGAFPFIDNGVILAASRGCPYNCAFCQPYVRKIFGTKVRYRTVNNVLEEIKNIVSSYKVHYLSFQDDTFTFRKEWVMELCENIIKEKINIQWSAQSRVNTIDDELAKAMSAAGCKCLFFGFESGSQKVLDFLRKGIKVEQSLKAAELCKKYGIIIMGDFMIGIPGEEEEDIKKTLTLYKKIRPEMGGTTYFTPIPGCDLYEYCKERNLIKAKEAKDYTRGAAGEKILGINYRLLEKYRNMMFHGTTKWYERKYYRKLVFDRWRYMLKKHLFKVVLYEFFIYSLPFNLAMLVTEKIDHNTILYKLLKIIHYKIFNRRVSI